METQQASARRVLRAGADAGQRRAGQVAAYQALALARHRQEPSPSTLHDGANTRRRRQVLPIRPAAKSTAAYRRRRSQGEAEPRPQRPPAAEFQRKMGRQCPPSPNPDGRALGTTAERYRRRGRAPSAARPSLSVYLGESEPERALPSMSVAQAASEQPAAARSAASAWALESADHGSHSARAAPDHCPMAPERRSGGHCRRGAAGSYPAGWTTALGLAFRYPALMPGRRSPVPAQARPTAARPLCFPAPYACLSFFVRDPELHRLRPRRCIDAEPASCPSIMLTMTLAALGTRRKP